MVYAHDGGGGLRSGGTRPADWTPLGYGSDPIGGNPAEVQDEAQHYRGVATEIQLLTSRLRRLAEPDDALKGDYTEALQDSCRELADDVDKAHGRFEEVASQLSILVPALDQAHVETAAALEQARSAQETLDSVDSRHYNLPERLLPDNPAHDDYQRDQRARTAASTSLSAARNRAQSAIDAFEAVAEKVARNIRAAADDKLKDGAFDGVKAWVREHAHILKAIAQILGAIVLVLAVAIVLLSNPAGWMVIAAFVAGAALLAVDVLLAASGEGSWSDVAFDVLGLATFGLGTIAGKLARGGRFLTLLRGGNRAGASAARTTRAAFNNGTVLSRITGAFRGASQYLTTLNNTLRTPLLGTGGPVLDDLSRGVGQLIKSRGLGTHELAVLTDDLARLRQLEHVGGSISRMHSGSIEALKNLSAIANVTTALEILLNKSSASGGLVDYHIPGLGHGADWLDDLTTVRFRGLL